ncbi:hypothetical protein, partial [Salmonella enterica]|uniref:hypothetical protein n=1 Tax=Salmonella enterica TaxID=28901 RepID=UPI003D2C7EB9
MVALVNASNPKYHGAMTTIKGQMVRVFEATVADVNAQQTFIPGTIVHADATHGLIVACMHNQFLSLQSVYVKEGYLSGFKL